MSMIKLASHILERARIKNRGITNFHLQQVLYFTLVNALKDNIIDKEWLLKKLYRSRQTPIDRLRSFRV